MCSGGLGEGGMASLGEPKMEMEMEETGEEHVGSESI